MKTINLPALGVMPTKLWRGANNLSDTCDPLVVLDWDSLWTEAWDTDAHFVCYSATGTGSDDLPRCNKALLPKLRDVGADLVTQVLVLDYDNPGHLPWSKESLAEWLESLALSADDSPICWQWSLLYTTTNGARLVYVLDKPVPVDVGEGHHRWLCQELRLAGINVDDIDKNGMLGNGHEAKAKFPTSDWTRCFRLPFVIRDGVKTWEADLAEFMEQEAHLSLEDLGTLEGKTKTLRGHVALRDDPKPEIDWAVGLMSDLNAAGKTIQSEFFAQAKRRLKGRECYDCLFRHRPLAATGARDSTIMKLVGEASTLLFRMELEGQRICTPEALFGLFLEPVMQLDPDSDTSDWTDVLWRHVLYCWSREEAEEGARAEEAEAKAQDVLSSLDRIVQGMREWCDHPLLMGGEAQAREFANDHLIAFVANQYYPMRPDGRYDSMGVSTVGLIARIKGLGMGGVISFEVPTAKGGVRSLSSQELVNEYGTVVTSIQGLPSVGPTGAHVTGIGTADASLCVPIYFRRTDLEPLYSPEVAAWLQAMFGPDYEQGCNWIGHGLAVEDGPTCAISVCGEAGAGKKMLVQGMAECFNGQCVAGAGTLTEQYQPALLKTPILGVDEGWPSRGSGGKHPADMFRELVGGSSRFIDRKYRAPVEARNPTRIMFTANNSDVVKMLCGSRDMSPEDRNALAIRILHYEIGDRASKHLRERGGTKHTRGWIAGDGGAPSRYVVAKHFLWIYENMRKPPGTRLLVEGNADTQLMTEMRTQGGSAPFVIETLIKMIEVKSRKFDGLAFEEGKVYVLASEVLDYFRVTLSKTCSERLTIGRVGSALKGLETETRGPHRLDSRPDLGKKRWHELDLRALQTSATSQGWSSVRLDGLVRAQEAE